jgi:hypothetical protein
MSATQLDEKSMFNPSKLAGLTKADVLDQFKVDKTTFVR